MPTSDNRRIELYSPSHEFPIKSRFRANHHKQGHLPSSGQPFAHLSVMNKTVTAKQIATVNYAASYPQAAAMAIRAGSADIKIEIRLAADTRRIFEALTIPEYMELWMSMPGSHPVCSSRVSRVADGFIIDHFCGSNPPIRIAGTYLMCLRRKLAFTWSVSGPCIRPSSFADIRLSGDFGKSILRLRHSGFASSEEYSWHDAFWRSSLSRLSRLLSGVSGACEDASYR